VLFALLAGTGLRIGEALGLKLGEHLSGDFSTIRVRQSVWRGSVQTPKTDNAVREIDLSSSLAAFLKAHIGDQTSGFLFQSESGRPLMQRNRSLPKSVPPLRPFLLQNVSPPGLVHAPATRRARARTTATGLRRVTATCGAYLIRLRTPL
jgi:integrase